MAIIWNNVTTAPQRWAAHWLRRRGWVCFYLDEQARHCPALRAGQASLDCWLALYQESEAREK